jgi:hypothetical protein
MFETLENNPTLRERVLGLTAIGAVLIGGAMGVDTMLTSGWQIGGDDANAAPVVYAESTPQIQDDVNHDWTAAPPRPVQLAAQDASVITQSSDDLDGKSGAVTSVSYAPLPEQQSITSNDTPTADQTADQQFQAIETDVRQATAAIEPNPAPTDDQLSPPPSTQG